METTRKSLLSVVHYPNISELMFQYDISIPPIVEPFANLATVIQVDKHVELTLHQAAPGFPNGCHLYTFPRTTHVEIAELLAGSYRLHLMYIHQDVEVNYSVESFR